MADEFAPRDYEVDVDRPRRDNSNWVAIVAILSCAVITLACIVGATIIVSAFFVNPPW